MKIIKTSSTQITPEQGQICNDYQQSGTNTYSCNYVNVKLEELEHKCCGGVKSQYVNRNTWTTCHIDFPFQFATIPGVSIVAQSEHVQYYAVANVSTTGFDARVYIDTAGIYNIYWTACN